MNGLLIILGIIAVGLLWYDDSSQRSALAEAQAELQKVTSERDQAAQEIARLTQQPKTPSWFQQRQAERPSALQRGY